MRRLVSGTTAACCAALLWVGAGMADDHVHAHKLPAGPIHDRHELMEEVGGHAKKIGEAGKAGQKAAMVPEAQAIAGLAKKAAALFPAGSTHPESRAKPEIWQDWPKFEADMAAMEKAATELAAVAATNGDTGAASKQLFATCKSCHDQFRVPED